MKKCVFAGTFDPPTLGHERVVSEGLKIFDEVVVAVLNNPAKSCLYTLEERIGFLNELFAGVKGVRVRSFSGAAVDLLKEENTVFYLRGVRDSIDFEYENRNFFASKDLMEEMVCVYLPAPREELHISSTLVRNSVLFKKDYLRYIPQRIRQSVQNATEKKDV